jgi:hypothetical protein
MGCVAKIMALGLALLALVVSGCAQVFVEPPSGHTTSMTGAGGASCAAPCLVATDCPAAPVCQHTTCDPSGCCGMTDDPDGAPAPAANECQIGVCLSGAPALQAVGVPCASGGGHVCDGAGSCVECLTTSDCADPEKPFCQAHACLWCGGTLGFPGVPLFPAGDYPRSILALDLNGDGKNDLVMADRSSNTVTVLLGRGKGMFDAGGDYPTGTNPLSVAAADLNGDGWPDLAVANSKSGTVSVLLNDGDGTFAPKLDYPCDSPQWVAAADLDGDGTPDLAVASLNSGVVSVLLNEGNGTFAPGVDYPVGLYASSVVAADLNGDGWPDLAVTNGLGTVGVLLNEGDGIFAPKLDYPGGTHAGLVVAADLNGDGKADLAVANFWDDPQWFEGHTVSVLLSNGDGSFGPKLDIETGWRPESIAVADLNGDGWLDLAVANSWGNVSVLLGQGDGTFAPKVDYPANIGYWEGIWSIAAADLNGDGWPDLALANAGSGTSVLFNRGDGTFAVVPEVATGGEPFSIAASDLNGDGAIDLAVANFDSDTVSVLSGQGDGTFAPKVDYPTGSNPTSVAAADLNGDGWPDLAVANSKSSTVSVLLGQGDGTFAPKVDYPASAGADPQTNAVVAADLNGDGRPDLAVTGQGSNTVSVLLNHGDGTFAPALDYPVGSAPAAVAAADLNGDGKVDLAVASSTAVPPYDGHTVSVLLNHGDGTFAPKFDIDTGQDPASVAVADMNGDGWPDLVVGNHENSSVSVLLNHGDGTFAPRVDYAVAKWDGFPSIAVADLNGDGRPDLAVNVQSSVNVLLGHGDGTFAPHVDYGAGVGLRSIAIADLNGDGRPDLAVGSHTSFSPPSGSVSVMLNTCLP